jgi:hypothetical protein
MKGCSGGFLTSNCNSHVTDSILRVGLNYRWGVAVVPNDRADHPCRNGAGAPVRTGLGVTAEASISGRP